MYLTSAATSSHSFTKKVLSLSLSLSLSFFLYLSFDTSSPYLVAQLSSISNLPSLNQLALQSCSLYFPLPSNTIVYHSYHPLINTPSAALLSFLVAIPVAFHCRPRPHTRQKRHTQIHNHPRRDNTIRSILSTSSILHTTSIHTL